MRGVGGPLLCVDDLLHDLSQDAGGSAGAVSPPASCDDASPLPPSRLIGLFEETYDRLNESLAGTDHSWTQLTLKLCYAVEAADKLISLAQSNSKVLLEKVDNLENTVKRCHSVLEAARALIGDKCEEEIAVDDQEG